MSAYTKRKSLVGYNRVHLHGRYVCSTGAASVYLEREDEDSVIALPLASSPAQTFILEHSGWVRVPDGYQLDTLRIGDFAGFSFSWVGVEPGLSLGDVARVRRTRVTRLLDAITIGAGSHSYSNLVASNCAKYYMAVQHSGGFTLRAGTAVFPNRHVINSVLVKYHSEGRSTVRLLGDVIPDISVLDAEKFAMPFPEGEIVSVRFTNSEASSIVLTVDLVEVW